MVGAAAARALVERVRTRRPGASVLLLLDARLVPRIELPGVAVLWLGAEGIELDPQVASGVLDGDDVTVDLMTAGTALEVALALAPARDAAEPAAGARMTLLELLGAGDVDAEAVERRWRLSLGALEAPIGEATSIDVRADVLITGAGAPDLLRTFLASLALAHPPTRLSFLLVGHAFGECARLPHTVGVAPALDGRAVMSLNAELARREQLLAAGGAPPTLAVVIEEFATLSEGLVMGIVDIARRGAGVGVHLVLATERSDLDHGGLRIDAPLHGHATIRARGGEPEPFQPADAGGVTSGGPRLNVRDFPFGPELDRTLSTAVATDLERLVDAVREAARPLPAQHAPWLPPLETMIPLSSLEPSRDPAVTLGVIDEPATQRRRLLAHDFERDGSLL